MFRFGDCMTSVSLTIRPARLRDLPAEDLAKLTAALDVLDHLTEVPAGTRP